MSNIQIIADSTADLESDYRTAHNVVTVPLRVSFGDEEFVETVDITPGQLYKRMRSSTVHPKTSQPTPAEFETAFRSALETHEAIICTTISSEMSGTLNSATQAKEAIGNPNIHLVDTRSASMGHGVVTQAVVEAVEGGASIDDALARAAYVIGNSRALFTVSSLEYLKRGGRIGGAQALLGSVLNIKPVLHVIHGKIEPLEKVRTFQRALDRIVSNIADDTEKSGKKARGTVGHADSADIGKELSSRVAQYCETPPQVIELGAVVGAHAGPGTIGLCYYIPQ